MITALGPEWRHRTLLREVNERIFALTQEFAPNPGGDLPIMVFCECGIDGCMTPIEMTVPEYEATREAPGRWVVSSEHVPSADSMLDHRNGYALIRDVPARTLYRGRSAKEGVDIAPDSDRIVQSLILLLAACEQAAEELDGAGPRFDGLGVEIHALGAQLHDVLSPDP